MLRRNQVFLYGYLKIEEEQIYIFCRFKNRFRNSSFGNCITYLLRKLWNKLLVSIVFQKKQLWNNYLTLLFFVALQQYHVLNKIASPSCYSEVSWFCFSLYIMSFVQSCRRLRWSLISSKFCNYVSDNKITKQLKVKGVNLRKRT